MLKLSSQLDAIYRTLPPQGRNYVASAYAWWSGRKKYGGSFQRWSEFLEASQWWPQERLLLYQAGQIRELLKFVFHECPFYRQVMEEKRVGPETMQPLDLLQLFPVIDRAVVRARYDDIKTNWGTDAKLTLTTSGTTGASLHVPHTLEALQREYAFRWQFYSMGGAKRGDKFALFQGHMILPQSRRKPPYHIRNFAEKTIMFSLYHMDDTTLVEYAKALSDFRPDFIYGYPSGIFVLARFLDASGLKAPPLKAIFTASEMLHDSQRDIIQKVFAAPIFQWYGQVETTANIQECPHHRLHIKEEYGLLELLTENNTAAQPGETARVVATGWGNKAFPLIRYYTGDTMILAHDQHCPCGRGGRIIERIMGRDDDFIVTPEGRFIGRLDFVFKAVNTVKESQIIQENLDHVTVLLVPRDDFSATDENKIVKQLQDRIGPSIKITIQRTDQIPRGKGGKFRYVVSKVGFKYGAAPDKTNPAAYSSSA